MNYCFCTHTELAWSVISLPEPPQFTTFDHDVWVSWDVQQLHLWPHKIGDRHIRQTVGSNLKHLWKNNKHLSELELCNTNTTSHTQGLFSRVAWHSHCWPKFHPIKIVELLLAPALLNRPWECLNFASTSLYISPFYCSDVAVVPTLRLLARLKSGSSFRWLPLALMIWSLGCFPRLEGRVRRSFPDKLISCKFSSFTMSLKKKGHSKDRC